MMTDRFILNEAGEPERCEDLLRWARWFQSAERHVAQDLDEGHDGDPAARVRVSTVFLGLDHNFGPAGPPVLWETMVFGGLLDGECQRYTSRDEAFIGHQDMCRRVQESIVR